MATPYVIFWLPWDATNRSHEVAAYEWVSNLTALLSLAENDPHLILHIEGVSALTDEFLRAKPDAGAQVRSLIAKGQLWVGPWFVRPAQTLAAGETMLRNLLLGGCLARELGASAQACFLFPSPVHVNQLPQILAGFGISAVAAPLSPEQSGLFPAAMRWVAPDDSVVRILPLCEFSADQLDAAEAPAVSGTTQVILCNAAGLIMPTWHPDADATPCGGRGNAPTGVRWPLPHWLSTSLESFAAKSTVPARQTLQGELLPVQEPVVSSATWSTPAVTPAYGSAWPHLRTAIWEAEALLVRWAEPWAAAAWLSGSDYPQYFLQKAWRHILLNHRRDAVGGCNSDAAFMHMLVRADRARHLAEAICTTALASVLDQTEAGSGTGQPGCQLLVANPSAWPRSEVITAQIALPADTQYLELATETGQVLPYQLHHAEPAPAAATQLHAEQRRFTISFHATDIPATGFRRLITRPAQHRPYFMGESIAAGNTLENKLLRVTVKANGALRIEDKRTGCMYDNCNVFEDGGDAGNHASFVSPQQDRLITTYAGHAHVSIVENGVLSGTIQVQHELSLPAELHPYRDRRSDQRVNCDITSLVTLRQGSDRVEIHTQVTNRAQDHRLRVLFSSDIQTGTCHVAQPFAVVERATRIMCSGGVDPERSTLPKLEFIDVSDEQHGLLVASRGNYEYEVKPTPAGTIALTLLRAIKPQEDQADTAAQAIDTHEFAYALIPHSGNWEAGVQSAWSFIAPLRTFTAHELGNAAMQATGPQHFSLVALNPAPLYLSAIKRSEDGSALIVRVFNPTKRELAAQITTGFAVSAAWLARLDETPAMRLNVQEPHRVSFLCGPCKIVTLRLSFSPPNG